LSSLLEGNYAIFEEVRDKVLKPSRELRRDYDTGS